MSHGLKGAPLVRTSWELLHQERGHKAVREKAAGRRAETISTWKDFLIWWLNTCLNPTWPVQLPKKLGFLKAVHTMGGLYNRSKPSARIQSVSTSLHCHHRSYASLVTRDLDGISHLTLILKTQMWRSCLRSRTKFRVLSSNAINIAEAVILFQQSCHCSLGTRWQPQLVFNVQFDPRRTNSLQPAFKIKNNWHLWTCLDTHSSVFHKA